MFGRRSDGKIAKDISNFDKMLPYIMSHRYDAQNFITQNIPSKPLRDYINAKKQDDIKLSIMTVILAAYIRTVGIHPELNRFVVNRKIYNRNTICVSFVVLRKEGETTIKIPFKGNETIFEISDIINSYVKNARNEEESTLVDKIIGTIFALPLVPATTVSILKWMDRHGMMPKSVLDASPFHSSLFFTNLASIKTNSIYHHIAEFGTVSVFVSMGNFFKQVELDKDGKPCEAEYIPLKIVTDERIGPGLMYARCFADLQKYMLHPELLEK